MVRPGCLAGERSNWEFLRGARRRCDEGRRRGETLDRPTSEHKYGHPGVVRSRSAPTWSSCRWETTTPNPATTPPTALTARPAHAAGTMARRNPLSPPHHRIRRPHGWSPSPRAARLPSAPALDSPPMLTSQT
ncbi:hypothetical protein BC937DRAFT_90240 [Endogone sp. FLAS-F59071]|nr:hypothetical protein BC937DRAFT_90240 [Endogone sp. FLAS-F59071]|eukprot:RUS17240.1 hypothetical protein BC937DRAFT_90240 [Endogone sp. FLAS-F59071]